MSDDRAFLDRVVSGREADPCSYRCWAKGCQATTGYQPDKTETGMRLLFESERKFYKAQTGQQFVGSYTCETHAPRRCAYCTDFIPWWDGNTCDYCDRYTDETG
jgi:hypothetical protein